MMNENLGVQLNVDPKEIKHFNNWSEIWWDVNGKLKPLHSMNGTRVSFIVDGIIANGMVKKEMIGKLNVLEGLNILDVGCGGGILVEPLAKLHANVVGIDPSEELIQIARNHAIGQKFINYQNETIEQHLENGNLEKYDAVILSEVVEYIHDKKAILEASVKALKPGGSIFVTTFNKTTSAWLFGIKVAEFILKSQGTHDWKLFISPRKVSNILSEFNCETILVRGMFYNLWTNVWSFWKNTSINYALHAVKATKKN